MEFLSLFEARPNLKRIYDQFNAAYFNNELPQELTVRWSPGMKRALGVARCQYGPREAWGKTPFQDKMIRDEVKQDRWITPSQIAITTLYDFTEEELNGILLHEMIHILFFAKGDPWEDHGPNFMAERERVEKESGIFVPEAEHPRSFQGRAGKKTICKIVVLKKGSAFGAVKFSRKVEDGALVYFADLLIKMGMAYVWVLEGEIPAAMLSQPTKRAVPKGRFSHYQITKEELDFMLKPEHSRVIYKV